MALFQRISSSSRILAFMYFLKGRASWLHSKLKDDGAGRKNRNRKLCNQLPKWKLNKQTNQLSFWAYDRGAGNHRRLAWDMCCVTNPDKYMDHQRDFYFIYWEALWSRKWSGHLGSPAYPSGALIEYVRIGGKLNFSEHELFGLSMGVHQRYWWNKGITFPPGPGKGGQRGLSWKWKKEWRRRKGWPPFCPVMVL